MDCDGCGAEAYLAIEDEVGRRDVAAASATVELRRRGGVQQTAEASRRRSLTCACCCSVSCDASSPTPQGSISSGAFAPSERVGWCGIVELNAMATSAIKLLPAEALDVRMHQRRSGVVLVELHCDAILFDMDGVLVESRAVVERVWRRWCSLRGFDAPAILRVAHGRRTEDTLRALGSDLDIDAELRWLEDAELSDRDGVSAVLGAVELVSQVPEGHWAVVTSAGAELARRRLEWCGVPIPASLVTADIVEEGKPSPEGYLRAASELRAQPARCVVVEDSPAGIAAARTAGMRVVGVTTTHEPDDLPPVDALLSDLTDLSLQVGPGGMILQASNPRLGAF